MASLVEVTSDWGVPGVFDVSQVFFEAGLKGPLPFSYVLFPAFGASEEVDQVFGLAGACLCP